MSFAVFLVSESSTAFCFVFVMRGLGGVVLWFSWRCVLARLSVAVRRSMWKTSECGILVKLA